VTHLIKKILSWVPNKVFQKEMTETFYTLSTEIEDTVYFFHKVEDAKRYVPEIGSEIYEMMRDCGMIQEQQILIFDWYTDPRFMKMEEKIKVFRKNPLGGNLQYLDLISSISENDSRQPEKDVGSHVSQLFHHLQDRKANVLPLVYSYAEKSWNALPPQCLPPYRFSENLRLRHLYEFQKEKKDGRLHVEEKMEKNSVPTSSP
jgi:hypothetical protein